jgi:CheY-like chemotaxis protein
VKNILIVDDDGAVLDVLARALKGYRVVVAREPYEGLQVAKGLLPLDLLITDFMMPSMMGDELVRRLRAERPDVKVLILTAHSDLLDAEHPAWWTNEPHLSKPLQLPLVRTMVARLIGPPADAL